MRGHQDDFKHLNDIMNNPGNFQELLKYRIDSCDKVLENNFKHCPKNATYRSKTTQNAVINCIGKFIRQKISSEIQTARFFSIMADETTDAGHKEQISLVIRFIDESSQDREDREDSSSLNANVQVPNIWLGK